jgi:hypothetical protein
LFEVLKGIVDFTILGGIQGIRFQLKVFHNIGEVGRKQDIRIEYEDRMTRVSFMHDLLSRETTSSEIKRGTAGLEIIEQEFNVAVPRLYDQINGLAIGLLGDNKPRLKKLLVV